MIEDVVQAKAAARKGLELMQDEMRERLEEAYSHEMKGRDQEYLKQARMYWEGHTQVTPCRAHTMLP